MARTAAPEHPPRCGDEGRSAAGCSMGGVGMVAVVDASVCEGSVVAAEIERMFTDTRVAYLHLHNARRGCFSCAVQRVPSN